VFTVDVIEGSIEGILLYYAETFLGNTGSFVLSRHGTATVCPSDPRWGQTHVGRLILAPKVTRAKVRVSIEYKDHPWAASGGNPHPTTCTVPPELVGTHQCVPMGVQTAVSPPPGGSFLRIVMDPPANQRCGIIGFWQSATEHLFSTNPWVDTKNSTGAFRTHRQGSPDGRPYPNIYPYCLEPGQRLYAFVLATAPVTFFVDTSREWMSLRPLVDFPPGELYRRVFGSVTANCPVHNYTAHRTQYAISETMDTGSANLRVVYPSDDLDVFYPPPLFASDPYHFVSDVPTLPATPNRFVVSLLLNQRLQSRSQPLTWTFPWLQNAYQWVSADEWDQCTLTLNGLITGADGQPIKLVIANDANLVVGLPACDPVLYANASRLIDQIQEETSELVAQPDASLADVYRLWFLQDRVASSNAFYSCKQHMRTFYTMSLSSGKTVTTQQCLAPFGSIEFENDPCCHMDNVTLYDNCNAAPRSVSEGTIESFTTALENATCSSRECAQVSLATLMDQFNKEQDPTACTNSIRLDTDSNVYWRCVNKIWGPEVATFAGTNCTHDIDCPGSVCNVHSKRCFVNVAEAEIALIDCIYEGVSHFTTIFVSNELGLNPADPDIKAKWQTAFSHVLPCSDPYTPVGFDLNLALYGRCHGCTGFALGTSTYISSYSLSPGFSWPSFGHDCWAPGSSSCSITTGSVLSGKGYCATLGCNHIPYKETGYFPYVSDPAQCTNHTFCGISDDGFFYEDVTSVIPVANCADATLCILANGQQIQTSDAASCLTSFSCDVDCNGAPCANENACLNSGSCSDSTDYDIGIWARKYEAETGGCFFTVRYRDNFNPTTSVCEPPFRNTILGCSVYPGSSLPGGPLFPITQSSCESRTFQYGDPSIVELVDTKWLTPAKTEAQCNNYGNVCDDPTNPIKVGLPTYTSTYTFNDQCSTSKRLFQWTPGRWLPGQPRNATVVVGALAPRFQDVPRVGLHLPRILSNLTRAVEKLQSLTVQSSAFCHTAYKQSLDELVCSCLAGSSGSFCSSNPSNTSSIGVACDEAATITAQDLTLRITPTSLPPATCANLFFSVSSILQYQQRDLTPLRTLLVNYQEDSRWAARNDKAGIYGRILTNGYSANFDTTIVNVTICIRLSSSRLDYNDTKDQYPILDLAKRPANSEPDPLIPEGVEVTLNGDVFCAEIAQFESNQIYYFLQRVDQNYSTVERTVFSPGEVAYISVLLALYCFGLVASIGKMIYLLISRGVQLVRLISVLVLMMAFFIFRVVLFALLLNQGLLGSTSSRAVSYLLFEFPILLYFAFVTNYVCVWITAISFANKFTADHGRNVRWANIFSIVLNLVILILFILIIILFETIIFEPYFICGGTILLYDSDQAYAVLLSYRIIFSTIAIILGLTLFLVALKFGRILSDPELKIKWLVRFKVYCISVIGGLGLIGQAIYFLIVTVTQTTPVNYASLSILLVLEIIPALLFVFVEGIKRGHSSSRSGNSGSGSTKGASGTGTMKGGTGAVRGQVD